MGQDNGHSAFWPRAGHTFLRRPRQGLLAIMVLSPFLFAAIFLSPAAAGQWGDAGEKSGSTVPCPRKDAPVCAQVPAPCFVKPCPLLRKTYPNSCLARRAGAHILYHSRCRGKDENRLIKRTRENRKLQEPQEDPYCKSWTDGCNICRRKRPGGQGDCSNGPCVKVAPKRCLSYFPQRKHF